MPNPTFPSDGGSTKVNAFVDKAGYASLQRGYGRETPAGATTDTTHLGVSEIPAAIISVSSTATPAVVTVSLPSISSGTNYLDGFLISGTGANATVVVQATISGVSTPVAPIYVSVPSGANTAISPIAVNFPHPIPASAPSTAITLTVPSFGTGNAGVAAWIFGHRST